MRTHNSLSTFLFTVTGFLSTSLLLSTAQSQRLCMTNSPTGALVFRINETEGNTVPNLILDMSRDVIGTEEEISLTLTDNPHEYFALEGKQLYLQKPVDRDATDLNTIDLKLVCSHLEANSSVQREIKVTVIINDLNDNPPQFINAPYKVEVSETTEVGELIFSSVAAVDADVGENSQIMYSFLPDAGQPANGSDYFEIKNKERGEIYLKRPLDYELVKKYQLVLLAEDRAKERAKRQTSSTTLEVNILNINDLPPLLHPPLLQGQPSRTLHQSQLHRHCQIRREAGSPPSYRAYFRLHPNTGVLTQVKPIPFGVDHFDTFVQAEERGGGRSVARLQINVNNRVQNNYPPVLQVSSLEGFIPENANIGTTVRISRNPNSDPLQVLVTDQDLLPGMPPATYQYILTGPGANIFAVNQAGYVTYNSGTLDADVTNDNGYDLTIQAREVDTQPIRSSRAITLKIGLIDVNDNGPRFDSQVYTAQVAARGTLRDILNIVATDDDAGPFGELRYRIVSVTNGGEPFFRYNKDDGKLVAIGPLTPGEQYQVLLEARDGGGRTAQTVILVSAQANNDNAPFINGPATLAQPNIVSASEFTATVSEATPPNTVVVVLGGETPGIRYGIVGGNDEGRFRIDSLTGTISTVAAFDRERTSEYRLMVQAVRDASIINTTIVIVDVMDENDNVPRFVDPQPISFQVQTGVSNRVIGRIRAGDPDENENGQVKLRLISPNQYFSLSEDGVLRTINSIPNDGRQAYQFVVAARDQGSPPRESRATVVVRVIPGRVTRPNTRPIIQPTRPTFPVSRVLPTVTQPSIPRTLEPIIPQPPPIFAVSQYDVQIDENAGPQEMVRILAANPNGGSRGVNYVLKQGDPTLFTIDEVSGVLSTLRSLDAEASKQHTLIVSTKENTRNPPPPRTTATINVSVQDQNDWKPLFKPDTYSATLVSDAQPGTPVVQVTSVDQDSGAPNNVFGYRISGVGNADQYFQVNQRSGLISVARSLSTLQSPELTVLVEARDRGNPPQSSTATVSIAIRQAATPNPIPSRNQQRIRFAMSSLTADISEAVSPPYFVQILPVENKPPNPRSVRCGIVSGNTEGKFNVATGLEGDCELRTRAPLDRENTDRYLLNVSVSGPSPTGGRNGDFAQVSLIITDANDNGPVFNYNYEWMGLRTYFAGISSEGPSLSRVLTINATDMDDGGNGDVRYALDPLTPDGKYFKINAFTGDLQNVKPLGGIVGRDPPYLQFRVEAKDSPTDAQPLTSKADVIVNIVTDANRFLLTAEGILPDQIEKYSEDMARILQSRTGDCKVLGVERIRESSELAGEDTPGTDVWWYAVNPRTKMICTRDAFAALFAEESVDLMRGQMSSWFRLRGLRETGSSGVVRSSPWDAAPVALIVLGIIIALGCLLAIVAMCYFWTRYKSSKTVVGDRMQLYGALPKYNALILPPSEKEYETQVLQMLEMAMAEDENGNGKRGPPSALRNGIEFDFTVEEGIYSIQQAGRLDPFPSPLSLSSRQSAPQVIIPPPDYPMNDNEQRAQHKRPGEKKTML